MMDREKVINKVKAIVADMQEEVDEWKDYSDSELRGGLTCDCDWWYKTLQTLNDALALLKAQEPKLLTWQEVIGSVLECKPAYIEVRESEDKEPGDDRWVMLQQYKDNLANGMLMAKSSYIESEVMFEQDYGKVWRCWDKEPTDGQRLAVKWE